ncbi:MAG TPA: hypothetical protein PLZ45_10565 [Ferruginibacter sp.]|nr:hypothetical protein [Ferruginibacter sp.]
MKHGISALCILLCSSLNTHAQTDSSLLLNEEFNRNRLGWIEEFTDAHFTGIKDGFLYIISKDTSKYQTSNSPNNVSFLWDLPSDFEISAPFYRLKDNNSAHFGITLHSATISYRFAYSDSCMAEVSEYNYSTEEETYLFSKKFGKRRILDTESAELIIRISGRNFSFLINNQLIGEGKMKARSWGDIRLFVTSGSAVKIDYLRIKKLEPKTPEPKAEKTF